MRPQHKMFAFWTVMMTVPSLSLGSRQYLIYPFADSDKVETAYEAGVKARTAFAEEMVGQFDEMASMEVFANYFMSCSNVGADLQDILDKKIGDQAYDFNPAKIQKQKILQSAGFDVISSRLFTIPNKDIESTVNIACLKNELQLQCALGFMNDYDKIQEHINELKKTDGNLKVMFEEECKAPQNSPKLYSCVGQHVHVVRNQCSFLLNRYNYSRTSLNQKINTLADNSRSKVNAILMDYEQNMSEEDLILANNEISETLNRVKQLEDYKCKTFNQLKQCVVHHMTDYCGKGTGTVLDAVLSVGYLKRERDVQLQQQFEQLEVSPSRQCVSLV
ncbi:unnamed protein product [Bursaphelenchus okinawaensis]|uniref:Uncharacterized protein n=1 Tax=Bursaphelenchus okinawaensis TaxID=465554 RepID=A0A811JT39_9BILA|nr:unnamed protein product [Bursaphelenchus okinawaensis]CAG9081870.1 unnamed protein product [Bursaphelenchus okinawaensis]